MPLYPYLTLALVDWENDTIQCSLLSPSHVPSTSHRYWADVSADEVSGTGYTAGGETLTNCAVSIDPAARTTTFDADDVTWSTATLTARYAAIWKDTGTDSTSPLVGIVDLRTGNTSMPGLDCVAAGQDLNIQWLSGGIFQRYTGVF
jgi:hypothetical protein